jgi:dipeptidyl aminopeptidase/acylaminoacyl peptidase
MTLPHAAERTEGVDPFQNIEKIGRVKAPTLIMHGMRDEIIPFVR